MLLTLQHKVQQQLSVCVFITDSDESQCLSLLQSDVFSLTDPLNDFPPLSSVLCGSQSLLVLHLLF